MPKVFAFIFPGGTMSSRIPILLYHCIDGSGLPTATDPQIFRAHLRFLHDHGWRSLSLLDFESYLVANEEVPARHFLLCLDNGYSSIASNALPIMKEFGYCGVAFIPVQAIGSAKHDVAGQPDAGSEHLKWQQIREIQAGGMLEFQPYAPDDQDFSERDASEIAEELLASLDLMSKELGLPHHYFNHLAWPGEPPAERWQNIATDVGFDFQYNAMHSSFRQDASWTQIPRLCFDACSPKVFKRKFSLQTGPLSQPWHLSLGLAHSAKQLYRRLLPPWTNAIYRKAKSDKETAFPSVLR
jgi:hypothetical protein